MSLLDELKPIFDRIAQHQQTDAEIEVLRQYLSADGQLVSQQGKYAVNLGQGQDIHIGDRIYQGADAETIRNIVRAMMQELQAQPDVAPVTEPTAEATQMSSGQRQRMEQRQATLQAEWDLRNQKLQRLRSALAIEAGTSIKFQLEKELAEEEAQLAQLSEALDQIERTITAAIPSGQATLVSGTVVGIDRTDLVQTPASAFGDLAQQARSRASTKVLNLFSKIQLLNKRQVEVDRLYVDVYLLEMQEFHATIPGLLAGREPREHFDQLGMGNRGPRSEGLAIAASADYPRLMVLGKPGSGKSTFLRHLAVGCAKGSFLSDYIPVLLELRDVDEAAFSLFQCIHREFELEQEAQTEQILKQGRVLILLDGLDEVPSSLRQTVQNDLRKFVRRYDKNRFILTCRTQTTEYVPEQFQAVEVADFKPEQVESFALNWFTAMTETPEQGIALKEHFISKLRESPQTASLAVTPVLLSLTCWVFDDLNCLPQKRSELYRDGLNLLLQDWDEGRGIIRDSGCDRYRQLAPEDRKRLLSYLAVRKFEQAENFVLFEESEICSYIAEHLQISTAESREVLGAIAQHHGLLIERATKVWSFSHLTFQEYLVAKWFCRYPQFLENLIRFVIHDKDVQWREVFLITAEMINNADDLLIMLKSHVDSNIASSVPLQHLLNWVYQKSNSVQASYKSVAIRAFYFQLSQAMPFIIFSKLPNNRYGDLNHELSIDLKLSYICTGKVELNYSLIEIMDKNLGSDVEESLTQLDDLDYGLFREEDVPLKYMVVLEDVLNIIPNGLLRQFLERIIKKAPSRLVHNGEEFKDWWKNHGEIFQKTLKELLKEHRNIKLDWHFTDEHKILLWQYHDVVNLLFDCFIIGSSVSFEVRREIEATLFLPIVEIEKRKREKAK
jgi:DNA polymerase III delta prime subunit